MSTFLILGGTGKVGSRLGQTLTRLGHRARLASRRAAVSFDWHDQSTWAPALAGTKGVFVVGPGSATDWSPSLAEFLSTAARSGVERAVLLSARGVEFLPDGAVARAESALSKGPVPWTILRPTHFAQNFTEAMFVPVDGRIHAPVGSGAEPFIDVQDIAEAAARVLIDGSFQQTVVALSGLEALTFDQAAQVLTDVCGVPIEFVPEPAAAHVARLRAAGTPEGYIRWRMAMLGGIERGEDAYLSDGVERILGRSATGFRTWAEREVPDSNLSLAAPVSREPGTATVAD